MSPATLIRRARADDAPRLIEILHATFESTWAPQVTPEAAQHFRDANEPAIFVAEHGLEFWVAELAGEVAGLVYWQDDFVHSLHIAPAHARTGLGAALMDVAERAIAGAGFAKARLETDTFNTPSRAFYAARGYEEVERYPDQAWESGIVTLVLEKRLG